jgi:DNA-binding beta-propeller fold protein YncE
LAVSGDGTRVFIAGQSFGYAPGYYSRFEVVAYDASSGARLWVERYDPGGRFSTEDAYALAVSPDDTKVFVTGRSGAIGTAFATVAFDAATGKRLWASRYELPGDSYYNVALAIAVSPDGTNVFVTGGSGIANEDYATVAYDARTGDQSWVSRWGGEANRDDWPNSLGVSPDGTTLFVSGYSQRVDGSDISLIAYDASSGAQLWVSRFGASDRTTSPTGMAVSPDGMRIVVTGASSSIVDHLSDQRPDYATVAFDASSGAQLWAETYDGPDHRGDRAFAIGISPDSQRVFVTGGSRGGTSREYVTLALDAATGSRLWVTTFDGPRRRTDRAVGLEVTSDGNLVVVTGLSRTRKAGSDWTTVAYDASTGGPVWLRAYHTKGGNGIYAPAALVLSPDGDGVFVTGGVDGLGEMDMLTISYSIDDAIPG